MEQTTPSGFTSATDIPKRAATVDRSTRLVIAVDRGIYRIASRWLTVVNGVFIAHFLSVLLAPVLAATGLSTAARIIYGYNGLFCHQLEDRSFMILGEPLACCERCAAIYGSIVGVGLLFAFMRERMRAPFLYEAALLALPAIIDGGGQALGLWQSTAASRVLSGLMLGAGMCWYVLPSLETGFRRIRMQLETLFSRLVLEGRAKPL
jgi:uncharacterized membrane protein